MVAVPDLIKQVLILRCWSRCEVCGDSAGLDPHHRRSRGMGGVHGEAEEVISHELSNYLAICRLCHDRIDAEPTFAISRGWLIPRAMPVEPVQVPAWIWTAQGRGWWFVCPPTIPDGFEWLDPLVPSTQEYLEALGLDWRATLGANALVVAEVEAQPKAPRGGWR